MGDKKGVNSLVFLSLFLFLLFPANTLSESSQQNVKRDAEKVRQIYEEKEKLNTEIDYFNEQLEFLSKEIERIDAEIIKNEERLLEIAVELKRQRGFLSDSLRILYEVERVSFWERLFTARSLSEVFSRDVYLEAVRGRLIDSTNKIAELKKEEEEKKEELDRQRNIQEVFRGSLALEKAESEATLEKIEKEEIVIRERFARMLSRDGIQRWCKNEGRAVIEAKHPVFRFPVDCGYISQGFGNTVFAAIDRAYGGAIHNGFDVGVNTGTPIFAIGDGEVFARGRTPSGNWGNWIIVRHDPVKIRTDEKDKDGNYIYTERVFYSLSAHMVAFTHLKLGERVTPNTVVGFVGGTPNWAPHLHLSLFLSHSGWADGATGDYPGNSVDPLDYMNIPISTVGTDWDARFMHF